MKSYWSLVSLAVVLVLGSGTPSKANEIDQYLETQMPRLHLPGISMAVVRDGHVIKAQGYGLANLELRAPVTPETVFEIGSSTKQFTAAAVMMLVEEGKIALDDPVTKFLPKAPATWKAITIRHLLSHTSGIQNHVAVPGYMDVFKTNLSFETFPTREELLGKFFKLPLEFEPGQTRAYDNTGYYLLGVIIEMVSGESYREFLEKRIFKPLGMTATRNTDLRPIVPNRASGYEWVEKAFENRPILTPAIALSAGCLLSNVMDLAKWDAALYTERLLKKESLQRIWTPVKARDGSAYPFDYGFGWFIDTYQGHQIVQHTGGTPGFSSAIYRFKDDKLTVIMLTNHSDRVMDTLAIDVAGMYLPALKRPERGTDPHPDTSKRLQSTFAKLLAGEHDPAQVTAPFHVFLTTATGKAFWQWFASLGHMESFFSASEKSGDMTVLRYRLVLGGNPYWFSIKVDAAVRIAQVRPW